MVRKERQAQAMGRRPVKWGRCKRAEASQRVESPNSIRLTYPDSGRERFFLLTLMHARRLFHSCAPSLSRRASRHVFAHPRIAVRLYSDAAEPEQEKSEKTDPAELLKQKEEEVTELTVGPSFLTVDVVDHNRHHRTSYDTSRPTTLTSNVMQHARRSSNAIMPLPALQATSSRSLTS